MGGKGLGVLGARAALVAACVLGASQPAAAEPQWNVGLAPGFCAAQTAEGTDFCFYGSARSDVLFFRERSSDAGFGPTLEVSTVGFDDLRLSAGASALLPVGAFPLVLSAAPQWVVGESSPLGVSGRVFWGFREYNHGSSYGAATGLLVGLDAQLGGKSKRVWQASLQIDAMWLALPVLLVYSWARGPSD